MEIHYTQCCAVQEIADLQYSDNAEDAFKEFCRSTIDRDSDSWYGSYSGEEGIHGFYTFTGVVGYKNSRKKPTYGPEFATYIRRHKLGRLTESSVAPNRVNHPDHMIRVWVWAPNPRRVRSLYKRLVKRGKRG